MTTEDLEKLRTELIELSEKGEIKHTKHIFEEMY